MIHVGKKLGQLGLIVQHLLEVRDVPAAIGAVAMEATRQVIDDPACRDVVKRIRDDAIGLLVIRVAGGELQQVEFRGLGKLRSVGLVRIEIDSAELRIAGLDQRLDRRGHQPAIEFDGRGVEAGASQPPHFVADHVGTLLDAGAVGLPRVVDAGQDGRESHLAGAILRGKIGSTRERLAIGGQEHRQRPASRISRAERPGSKPDRPSYTRRRRRAVLRDRL